MKKHLVIILLLFVGIATSSAQDIIYKKNHEEIKAKITEIGIDEIKYKMFDLQEGPDIVILKNDIWKIKFSNLALVGNLSGNSCLRQEIRI